MQTPANMNTDMGAASAKKAADMVTQGLGALYKECHKMGESDLCDALMAMMQDVASIEQAIEQGPQDQQPLPADDVENAADAAQPGDAAEDAADGGPPHGMAAQDAALKDAMQGPVGPGGPANAEADQGEPMPHRGATSIADAAGMLHDATKAGAAKRKLMGK